MGTFKKTKKFTKSFKHLDQKIQSLNNEMVKTGMTSYGNENEVSDEVFDWRKEFGQFQQLNEEVDTLVDEVREKHKKLSSVENSLTKVKLNEANTIFEDLYSEQVHNVVEKYISKYALQLKDLREDVVHEVQKGPKNLKLLEERLDKLDKEYQILSEKLSRTSNLLREQEVNEDSPITIAQLKYHYQTLVGKLQENIAMGSGGGGEVNLKYLDDVVGIATNPSEYDGKYLKYDHSSGNFVFEEVTGISSDQLGIQLTDLSVISTIPGISTLSYDEITGIFEYTPPDLSGFSTSGNLVGFTTFGDVTGIITSGQVVGLITSGDLVGFTTIGDVSGIITSGQVVGLITSGDLVGFTTSGDIAGIVTSGQIVGLVTFGDIAGIVTSGQIVGLVTSGDLVGFTTEGDLVGFITDGVQLVNSVSISGEGLFGSAISGDVVLENTGVTFITAGSGIGIDTSTGNVTISVTDPGGVSSISAGAGIGVNNNNGDVTVTNTGVLQVNSGDGINVDESNGVVTIENTGVLSINAGSGINVSDNNGVVTISFIGSPDGITDVTAGPGIIVNQTGTTAQVTNDGIISITNGDGISVSTLGNTATIVNTGIVSLAAGIGISIDQIGSVASISAVGVATSAFLEGNFVRSLSSGPGIELSGSQGDVEITLTGIGTTPGGVSAVFVGAGLTINQNTGDVLIGLAGTGLGVNSIQFIGDGVSASGTTGDVTVDLSGIGSGTSGIAGTYVRTLSAGTGISLNNSSGDIIITNTGTGSTEIVQAIIGGPGIQISGSTGIVEISTTGVGLTGAVNSISVGDGLTINQSDGDVLIGLADTGVSVGGGTSLTVLNVSPGISSIIFDPTTGVLQYVPPDLSEFIPGVEIRDDDNIIGIATKINFSDNLFVSQISSGIVTVSGPSPDSVIAGIDTAGTTKLNNLIVSGVSTFISTVNSQTLSVSGVAQLNELQFADLKYAYFGDNDELQIHHSNDGNSYITTIDGNLIIQQSTADDFRDVEIRANPIEKAIVATSSSDVSSVQLYYNGFQKFETSAEGVNVIGVLETDNLLVTGISSFVGISTFDGETTFNVNVGMGTDSPLGDLNFLAFPQVSNAAANPKIAMDNAAGGFGYNLYYVDAKGQGTGGTDVEYLRNYLNSANYNVSIGSSYSFLISNTDSFTFDEEGVSDSDVAFRIIPSAETELRYNYSKRLETLSYGIKVYDQVNVGSGVSISGTDGNIYSTGIVTATAFYGDGSQLTNVNSGNLVGFDTSGQSSLTNLSVSGIATVTRTNETFSTLTNASGSVSHDCSASHIFYHTSPSSDFTVNLTNFTLSAEHATTISVVISQGNPAYMPTAVEISGSPATVKWQGNQVPSGTIDGIDSVSFSILRDGGAYVILGQSVSFGGV